MKVVVGSSPSIRTICFLFYFMKAKLVKKEECMLSYEAYAEESFVSQEYKRLVEEAIKTVKVDGFKIGTAPVEIVEQRLGSRLLDMVADTLYRKVILKIIEDDKLKEKFINISDYKPLDLYTRKSVKISFDVEINPEVPEVRYDKIKIALPNVAITNEDLEFELKSLGERFATPKAVENEVILQKGHIAKIDFVGRLKNEVVKEATGNDYSLEIGSNTFVPGFEEQLIGLKAGQEKTIIVKFPDDYHSENFAGQDVEFDVRLRYIQEKQIPEMNDEFAKKFGLESITKLSDEIKKNIEKINEETINRYAKFKIDNILREKYCGFTVPNVFFKPELKKIKESLEKRYNSNPDKKTKTSEEIEKEATDIAKKNIGMSYIYRNIIASQKIEATEDEINEIMEQESARTGVKIEDLQKEYNEENSKKKSLAISFVQERRSFDWILSKVSLTRYDVKAKDLQSEMQKLWKELDEEIK